MKHSIEYKIVDHPTILDGLRVIQDIDEVVKTLKNGETICRYERGDSMAPVLVDSSYARLTPLQRPAKSGDAVFCKVGDWWMTHMVWIVNEASGYYLIGSSSGEMYGWTNEILALATPMPYLEARHED